MTSAVAIPPNWIRWIEENSQLGVAEQSIRDILISEGFDRAMAEEEIERASQNTHPRGSQSAAEALQRLESLLDVYAKLRVQCGQSSIDRVSQMTPEMFFRWYYSVNTPVILTDRMNEWRALHNWTPESLDARFGDEMIEMMDGREADPDYEINCQQHKTSVRFCEFIAKLRDAGETNDFYMVANNHSMDKSRFRELLDEIQYFDGILDAETAASRLFLWFGPAGTVTPLHYDTMNILLAQVMGRKQVTMIPSFQSHLMYNEVGVYSRVNYDAPNYARYPLFRKVTPIEVILEPGEALFIPVGWWHHVRSLDVSISMSFTNFAVNNSYAWHS